MPEHDPAVAIVAGIDHVQDVKHLFFKGKDESLGPSPGPCLTHLLAQRLDLLQLADGEVGKGGLLGHEGDHVPFEQEQEVVVGVEEGAVLGQQAPEGGQVAAVRHLTDPAGQAVKETSALSS